MIRYSLAWTCGVESDEVILFYGTAFGFRGASLFISHSSLHVLEGCLMHGPWAIYQPFVFFVPDVVIWMTLSCTIVSLCWLFALFLFFHSTQATFLWCTSMRSARKLGTMSRKRLRHSSSKYTRRWADSELIYSAYFCMLLVVPFSAVVRFISLAMTHFTCTFHCITVILIFSIV